MARFVVFPRVALFVLAFGVIANVALCMCPVATLPDSSDDWGGDSIVFLRRRGMGRVHDAVRRISDPDDADYGSRLAWRDVAALTAPPTDVQNGVLRWLREACGVEAHDSALAADGSAVRVQGASVECLCSAQRPREVSHVSFPRRVLRERGTERTTRLKTAAAATELTPTVVTPSVLQATMGLPRPPAKGAAKHHPRNVQAFFQSGQHTSLSDLTTFAKLYFPPNMTSQFTVEKFINANPPFRGYGDGESNIDAQYLIGTSLGVRTWVYSYADGFFCHDLARWGTDTLESVKANPTEYPLVISMSYGANDVPSYCLPAAMERLNEDLAIMAALGISVLICTQDYGLASQGLANFNLGYYAVSTPSESPFATAVGALNFVANTTDSELRCAGYSGGGVSQLLFDATVNEDVTSYLEWVQSRFSTTLVRYAYNTRRGARAVPDLSTLGSNFEVVYEGSLSPASGTSASTPVIAGMASLLNDMMLELSNGTKSLGLLRPFISKAVAAGCFTDITADNGGEMVDIWPAAQGWDACSGYGMPNFVCLQKVLRASLEKDATAPQPSSTRPTPSTPSAEGGDSCTRMRNATGAWSTSVHAPTPGFDPVFVANGSAIVAMIGAGGVMKLDAASGAVQWATVMALPSGEAHHCAVFSCGGMLVASSINATVGLNASTGAVQWTLGRGAGANQTHYCAACSADGGRVVGVIASLGELTEVDAWSGVVVRRVSLGALSSQASSYSADNGFFPDRGYPLLPSATRIAPVVQGGSIVLLLTNASGSTAVARVRPTGVIDSVNLPASMSGSLVELQPLGETGLVFVRSFGNGLGAVIINSTRPNAIVTQTTFWNLTSQPVSIDGVVAVDDRWVIYDAAYGNAALCDLNGDVKWTATLLHGFGEVNLFFHNRTFLGGTVIIGTALINSATKLFAIHRATGEVLWAQNIVATAYMPNFAIRAAGDDRFVSLTALGPIVISAADGTVLEACQSMADFQAPAMARVDDDGCRSAVLTTQTMTARVVFLPSP